MTTKKNVYVAGKTLSKPSTRFSKSMAASVLTQGTHTRSHTVASKSGKVISRAVTTHREALKRLANR